MELAVVIGGRCYIERDLGPGTSMDAEWLALIHAVRLSSELALEDPVFLGDAKAVIVQATGAVWCPLPYVRHLQDLRAIMHPAERFRVRFVKRTQNLAGIRLAMLYR